MGLLNHLEGNLIFLDTAPLIYFVEEREPYGWQGRIENLKNVLKHWNRKREKNHDNDIAFSHDGFY